MKINFKLAHPILVMLLLIAFSVVFFYGKNLLVPLAFGGMFAFLLNPVYSKLIQVNINKYFSSILSVSIILIFVLIFLSAFGWQIQQLFEERAEIKKELIEKQEQLQNLTKRWFGISAQKQKEYAEKVVDSAQENISSMFGNVAGVLSNFFLSLIYAILFLTERKRIQQFLRKIFSKKADANDITDEVGQVVQNYLSGKLIIIGILAIVYSIGFVAVGIKYAILIGVLAAFFTFIPYIGNIIGGALAAILTFATGGSMIDILIIFGIMGTAQVIESYILEPWIVGKNISLNPLFSILGVIAFSMLWGVAGAVLALPLVGIIKVIFDHFEFYQPIAFLMGDEEIEK